MKPVRLCPRNSFDTHCLDISAVAVLDSDEVYYVRVADEMWIGGVVVVFDAQHVGNAHVFYVVRRSGYGVDIDGHILAADSFDGIASPCLSCGMAMRLSRS